MQLNFELKMKLNYGYIFDIIHKNNLQSLIIFVKLIKMYFCTARTLPEYFSILLSSKNEQQGKKKNVNEFIF